MLPTTTGSAASPAPNPTSTPRCASSSPAPSTGPCPRHRHRTSTKRCTKLERTVAADVVVAIDAPPHLSVVERANSLGRTLHIRYVNDRGEARDRTIEPWLVFNNWGRWYVQGRDLDDAASADAKWFRVDRIVTAELGTTEFTPPPDTEIPEWFDLGGEETVTLRLPADAVDALPTPRRIDAHTDCGDGTVELTVTVNGRQRLERLLVVIPATAADRRSARIPRRAPRPRGPDSRQLRPLTNGGARSPCTAPPRTRRITRVTARLGRS